jgi:hypothetical protein
LLDLIAYRHKVISTLLEAGFSREDLGQDNLETIAAKIQHALALENGLVGFGNNIHLLTPINLLTLI